MIRLHLLFLPVLACALLASACQDRPISVSGIPQGLAGVPRGEIIAIERGQVGVTEVRIAPDRRTVGWLEQYRVGDVDYPISGTLVVWRGGKIARRFPSDQVFYSWVFYARGRQVVDHVGPLHGESKSHCELRDVQNGRLLAIWDGELDSGNNRPEWTKGLGH